MSYGSRDGVEAYIKHMRLDTTNSPSSAQVETWLSERSAILDGWLHVAGYVVPVTSAAALTALGRFANLGAAADAELTQISAAFSMQEESRRDVGFEARFREAQAWIESGAPAGLGVSQATTDAGNLSFVRARYTDESLSDEYSRPIHWWNDAHP